MRFNVILAASFALLPAFSAATANTAQSILGCLNDYTTNFQDLQAPVGQLGSGPNHNHAPQEVVSGLVEITARISADISVLGSLHVKISGDEQARIVAAFREFATVSAVIFASLQEHVTVIANVGLAAHVSASLASFESFSHGLCTILLGLGVDATVQDLQVSLKAKLDAVISVFSHAPTGPALINANVDANIGAGIDAKVKANVAGLLNLDADINL